MRAPRITLTAILLGIALASGVASAQSPAAAPAPAGITAADAAPFLGDWTLNMNGAMGPAAILLSIKSADGKVAGEISSDMMPKTAIEEVAKTGTSLVLKYTLMYEGNAVPVVVTLSPAADKIGANLDFAGGAYVMDGTATKAAAK